MIERELHKTFISNDTPILFNNMDDETVIRQFKGFSEFMMMYNCAIKEVRTKFEVLNDDFSVAYNRNPIEMIKSRVKSPISIVEKLKRKNLPVTMESVLENLNDVAGVRVICSFIDDIYMIGKMLTNQDDITLIEVKDYIKNPKPNGYRSYHMIVEIPVFFSNRRQNMRVEIQLRTIAMDFWASLEHKMHYKRDFDGADVLEKELAICADVIASTDEKMQKINYELARLSNDK
ncbi:MAG: GTP pyrophosphokinase family protein [Ruminococcaceae bacterium]|nr:GTP pyrophosphokinase family protein [Oscillospiraceae bacterium]